MDLSTLLQTSPNVINTNKIEAPNALDTTRTSSQQKSGNKSFENAIQNAIQDANELHVDAEEAIRRLASGEDVDLHGTMIAIEKAGIATRLTLQVRNKALEAYQEIMRMQV